MTTAFSKIAFWEGISLLLLLFVAMPFKYLLNLPVFVQYIGMAHGILFLLYIVMALYLSVIEKWTLSKVALVCFLSVVPFGVFYNGLHKPKTAKNNSSFKETN